MGINQVPAQSTVASVTGTAGRTTSSGGTTPVIDLATSGVSATTYGSASLIPALTVDAYGRVTSATTNAFSAGSMTAIVSAAIPTNTTSFTISSIPGTYTDLRLVFLNPSKGTTGSDMGILINGVSSATYGLTTIQGATVSSGGGNGNIPLGNTLVSSPADGAFGIATFYHYANTSIVKSYSVQTYKGNAGVTTRFGALNSTSAISSLTCSVSNHNFTGGSYILYGVN